MTTVESGQDYTLHVGPHSGYAVGDVVTITGVKRVNRINGKKTKQPAEFVITGVLDRALSVYPAILSKGRYKTVSRLPRNGDVLERSGV